MSVQGVLIRAPAHHGIIDSDVTYSTVCSPGCLKSRALHVCVAGLRIQPSSDTT